jgi:hypothetical protein
MDDILNNDYVGYLNSRKPHVVQCNLIKVRDIRSDVIDDTIFDIQDLKETIKQPPGTGSATYDNRDNKIIAVIDYESFLSQILSKDAIKTLGMKKCDFIVYDLEKPTFFILNELSQSGSAKNKYNDARKQLHNAVFHLTLCPATKSFIDKFNDKICIFSNRTKPITTPENIADPFDLIRKYLHEPIVRNFKPIEKCGFRFIETPFIQV